MKQKVVKQEKPRDKSNPKQQVAPQRTQVVEEEEESPEQQ